MFPYYISTWYRFGTLVIYTQSRAIIGPIIMALDAVYMRSVITDLKYL